ncbi:unnamed protein product [Durusdinium trenchii]|uniref:Uncharacterized protein n=1 Tax=Durusdinium trenchii TaxID=1381693 RepID=A0ABP0JXN0_9DINO
MELGESQENGIKDTESCKGIANDHSAGWPFEGSALARTRRVSSFKANYQKAAETAEKWRSLRADDWDPMMVGGHWAIGGRGYQVGGAALLALVLGLFARAISRLSFVTAVTPIGHSYVQTADSKASMAAS